MGSAGQSLAGVRSTASESVMAGGAFDIAEHHSALVNRALETPSDDPDVWGARVGKSSDHPDLHVKPENAEPIGLPVADVVTRANVQHVSWELVREGKAETKRRILPIDDLIATQQVVDKKRVAKHEKMLAETGELEKEGAILVLEWDGDLFMLGGHHGTQAAKNLGWTEVPADVMVTD